MKNSEQPAYPQSENWQNDMERHIGAKEKYGSPSLFGNGLTKREVFAMAAMQGLLASGKYSEGVAFHPALVNVSIEIADDLLVEMSKENNQK